MDYGPMDGPWHQTPEMGFKGGDRRGMRLEARIPSAPVLFSGESRSLTPAEAHVGMGTGFSGINPRRAGSV